MYSRRRLIFGVASTVFVTFTEPALARRLRFRFGTGIRGAGRKTYSDDVLTVDQLKECLDTQDDLEKASAFFTYTKSAIEAQGDKLNGVKRDLEIKQITLDRYSEVEVNAYNASVAEYERLRNEYNSMVADSNAENERYNSKVSSFNFRCAEKRYYEDDLLQAEGLP